VVEVSRLRASTGDAAIPPSSAVSASVEVHTFAPQVGLAHARLLAMLGVESAEEVVNGSDFAGFEALAALHLIYAGASAHGGPRSSEGQRAEWYRARAESERRRLVAELDSDGDGVAESVRRPGVGRFVRG